MERRKGKGGKEKVITSEYEHVSKLKEKKTDKR